jgi:hypothetical protein
MIVLLIVVAAVVLLAVVLSMGGGLGRFGSAGPVVHRRIVYRRPSRRVITEHHVVDDPVRADDPLYRP